MGISSDPRRRGGTLFSPIQSHLLGLLFGQPGRRFQSAELIRMVQSGTGAVHRQLQQFASSGLVTTSRLGNQKYYQANADSPIFNEMRGIVLKTVGLADPLREALTRFNSEIDAAFVYGSIASDTSHATSDIDLMVLSNTLTYAHVFEALQPAEQTLARKVNPIVMALTDWQRKRSVPDSFAARVAAGSKLFIIGGEDDLC